MCVLYLIKRAVEKVLDCRRNLLYIRTDYDRDCCSESEIHPRQAKRESECEGTFHHPIANTRYEIKQSLYTCFQTNPGLKDHIEVIGAKHHIYVQLMIVSRPPQLPLASGATAGVQ